MTDVKVPASVPGPAAQLYEAEALIREQHRASDPAWMFWTRLADFLNAQASRVMTEGEPPSPREARVLQHALGISGQYIDIFGPAEEDPLSDPRHEKRASALEILGDPGADYPLDEPCPECGKREVSYNGSYGCEACGWAPGEEGNVQPWLRSLIRLRRSRGEDTTAAERYLTRPMPRDPLDHLAKVERLSMALDARAVADKDCPTCKQPKGERCRRTNGRRKPLMHAHKSRKDLALEDTLDQGHGNPYR